jgi:hypothetical protein
VTSSDPPRPRWRRHDVAGADRRHHERPQLRSARPLRSIGEPRWQGLVERLRERQRLLDEVAELAAARPASFRPEIDIADHLTRVLVEHTAAIDASRPGGHHNPLPNSSALEVGSGL